tara:strand:+ start:256 stop:597 length:342 start_codon:yes stop_codon:yes gene_type:complete
MGVSAEAGEVWLKGLRSPDECSQLEYVRFLAQLQSMLICHQTTFRLEMHGTLDGDIRASLNSMLVNIKDQPGFKKFWSERCDQFDAPFRRFVEDLMRSAETSAGSSVYGEAPR